MLKVRPEKRSIWIADFETTTLVDDCRVWGWGIAPLLAETIDDVSIGQDIKSFLNELARLERVVYFHNLAFDGTFILDFLLKNGYKHVAKNPRRGEFSSLISDMGKFYSIIVHWTNGRLCEFRDSLKKFPNMSVANVAKTFQLEVSKGELDYELTRPIGWVITEAEANYIKRDVLIVAQALAIQIGQGMRRLTVGADALAEYKSLFNKKMFDATFPILPVDMDSEIRKAYRGGFTYADERTKGKIVGEGQVFDVNSLYPAVMYKEMLPYGEPNYVAGLPTITDEFPLFIASITLTAKLKPGHIPCIQIKNNPMFSATEYLKEIVEPTTLYLTNVDLALWSDHYDLDILTYNGGWQFQGAVGLFRAYIDKWSKIKAESRGGLREIAKLHLNSLYGKFATNPNVTGKVPVLKNGRVALVTGPKEERNPIYTAMGVFITAYARDLTVRAAQRHYDRFLYADTDSLHLTGLEPTDLNVHPTKMGAWKREYEFKRALFARAKAYTEQKVVHPKKVTRRSVCAIHGTKCTTELETHIAGLPREIAHLVTFDDYMNGRVFPGKLHSKKVPGGIVLEKINFTLERVIQNG